MLLRVKIDGGHYLGFIEVTGTTSLKKLRKEISISFDSDLVPSHYQFLAPAKLLSRQLESNSSGSAVGENHGSNNSNNNNNDEELVPVGTRRENTFLAKLLLPSVSLLPVTESPIASGIYVDLWTCSHRFRMWALPTCEIKHLREEASRFWHLNPADTVLVTCERFANQNKNFTISSTVEEAVEAAANGEGRVWPDGATVHTCLAAFSKVVSLRKAANTRIRTAYKDEDDSQFDNENDVGPQPVFSLRMSDPKIEKLIDSRTLRGKVSRTKEGGGINEENLHGKVSSLSSTGRRQSKRASFAAGEKVPPPGHYIDPDLYKEIYDVSVGGDEEDNDSGSAAEDVGGASTRSLLTLGTATGGVGSKRRNLMTRVVSAMGYSQSSSSSSSMININNGASVGNQIVSENFKNEEGDDDDDEGATATATTLRSRNMSVEVPPPSALAPPPPLPLLHSTDEEKLSSLSSIEAHIAAPPLHSVASFQNNTLNKRRSVANSSSQSLSALNYHQLLASGPVSTSLILTSLAGLSQADADFFAPFASIEPALWRTFARYAVSTGGAWSESRRLRLRQWRLMLDDGGLLSPSCATSSSSSSVISASSSISATSKAAAVVVKPLSTEAADLIFYSNFGSEGTSKGISGNGIDYLQFLRCLVAVAANRDPRRKSNKSSTSISTSTNNNNNNNSSSSSRLQRCLSVLGETTVDSLAGATSVVAVMLSTPAVMTGDQASDDYSNSGLILDQPSAGTFLSLIKDSILPNCARFNAESWAKEADHLTAASSNSNKAPTPVATGGSKFYNPADHNTQTVESSSPLPLPQVSASSFILSVLAPALRPAFSAFALSCATSPSLAIYHALQQFETSSSSSSSNSTSATPVTSSEIEGGGSSMSMDALREREKASRLSSASSLPLDIFEGASSSSSPLKTRLTSSVAISSSSSSSSPGGADNINLPTSPLQKQIARLSLASQGLSPNSSVTRAMIGALTEKSLPFGGGKMQSKRTSRSTLEPPSAALSRAYATQVVNSRRQTLLINGVEGGYASRQLHQQLFAAIPPVLNQPTRSGGGGGGSGSLSRKGSAVSLNGGGGGGVVSSSQHRTIGLSSTIDSERMSIEDFVRFVTSLGLATLGPKAAPMPTRLLVEIALASACSEGLTNNDDAKPDSPPLLSSAPSFYSTASSTASTSGGKSRITVPSNSNGGIYPENAAIRKRSFLTFPQFLLAIGRLAIQLTDLFAAVVSPHSSETERLRLLPPLLRVKALLQQAASTSPSTSFTDDTTAVDLVHQSSSLLRSALLSSQAADERSCDYIGIVYELSKKLSLNSALMTSSQQQQRQHQRGQGPLTKPFSSSTHEEEKKGDVNNEGQEEVYSSKVARFVEGTTMPLGGAVSLSTLPQNASVVSSGIISADPPKRTNQKNRVYKRTSLSSQAAASKKKIIIAPPIFSPRPPSKSEQGSDNNNDDEDGNNTVESFEERRMKLFQLEQLWQYQRQMNDVEKFLLAQRKAEAKAVSDYNRAQGPLAGPQFLPAPLPPPPPNHHQHFVSSPDSVNQYKSAETFVVGSPRSPSQQLHGIGGGGGRGGLDGDAIGREGYATQSSADTAASDDARLSKLKRQMLINADIERRHALWAKLLQQREATQNAISSALTVPLVATGSSRPDGEERLMTTSVGVSSGINRSSSKGTLHGPSPDRAESIRSSPSNVSPKGLLLAAGGSGGSLIGEGIDGSSPTKSEILQADLLFAYGGGFMQHVKKQQQQQQQFPSYPPNIAIPKDSSSPASQPETRPATPSQFQTLHSTQMSITPTVYSSSLRAASVPPSPSALAASMSLSSGVTNSVYRGGAGGGLIAPSRSPISSVSSSLNSGGGNRGGGGGMKKSASSLSIAMMSSSSPAPSPPASSTMTSSLPPLSSRTSSSTAIVTAVPISVNGNWNRVEETSSSTTVTLASSTLATTITAAAPLTNATYNNNTAQVNARTSDVTRTVANVREGPVIAEVVEANTIKASTMSKPSGEVVALSYTYSHLAPPLSPAKSSPSSVSPPSPKIPIAANSGSLLLVQHHDMITAALEARRQESRSSPSMATNLSSAEEDDDDKSSSATEEGTASRASLHVLPRRPDFENGGGGIASYRGGERNDDETIVSTTSARTEVTSNTDSITARDAPVSSQFGSVSVVSTSGLSLSSSRSDTSQQQQGGGGGAGGGGGGGRPNLASSTSSTSGVTIPLLSSPNGNTAFSPVIPQAAVSKLSSPSISLSSGETSSTLVASTHASQQQQQQGQRQTVINNSKPLVSGTAIANNAVASSSSSSSSSSTVSSSTSTNTTTGRVVTAAGGIAEGGVDETSDAQTREILARRLVLKRMMQSGATFLKFGRQGFPHSRIIWLTEDLSALRWRKPGTPMPDSAASYRDLSNTDSGILVNDIADILKGSAADGAPQTAVFKRNAARVTNGALCLSVVTKSGTRTLDLECESVTMADDWALGLLSLKRFRSLL